MKSSFRKRLQYKLFGIKIFEATSDYVEHVVEKDTSDDEFYIDLVDRDLRTNK